MSDTADLTWDEARHQVVALMKANHRTHLRYIASAYPMLVLAVGGSA